MAQSTRNKAIVGAITGLVSAASGIAQGQVAAANAKTQQERDRLLLGVEQQRVDLQRQIAEYKNLQTTQQRESTERMALSNRELQENLKRMELEGRQKEIGLEGKQALSLQEAVNRGIINQTQLEQIGALGRTEVETGSAEKIAGIRSATAREGFASQERQTSTQTGAQRDIAELQAGVQRQGFASQEAIAEINARATERAAQAKAEIAAAADAPAKQAATAKAEGDLRNELTRHPQTKEFMGVRNAYDRVQAAGQNPTPAGDIALIFNYMRMLDPASTVREGEFATAQNAGSIPDRVRAQYNKVVTGESLSEPIRNDYLARAGMLFDVQAARQKSLEGDYRTLATDAGLNPDAVILHSTSEQLGPSITQTLTDAQVLSALRQFARDPETSRLGVEAWRQGLLQGGASESQIQRALGALGTPLSVAPQAVPGDNGAVQGPVATQ